MFYHLQEVRQAWGIEHNPYVLTEEDCSKMESYI